MKKEFFCFGNPYYITDSGEVYNRYGRRLHHFFRHEGEYPHIEIRHKENGVMKRKKIFIHRLMAELFIPNPNNLPQVNHIDGDKSNYQLSNLEWVTAGNNQNHSRYVLGHQTGFADTAVRCVETKIVYKSTRDAWRDTGAGCSHISECVRGKRKTAGGYHWEVVK
jgi:hypothetical protein